MTAASPTHSASSSPVQRVRTGVLPVSARVPCVCGQHGCFLAGCRPEQQMMYAGSKNKLVHTVQLTKVRELRLFSIIIIKIFSDCGRPDKTSLARDFKLFYLCHKALKQPHALVFPAGVWDQEHGGPDGGVAQGETRLLRLNAVSIEGPREKNKAQKDLAFSSLCRSCFK